MAVMSPAVRGDTLLPVSGAAAAAAADDDDDDDDDEDDDDDDDDDDTAEATGYTNDGLRIIGASGMTVPCRCGSHGLNA